MGQGQAAWWLKTDFILGYFGQPGAEAWTKYRGFVEELIARPYDNPLQEAIGSAVLGTAEFVERIRAQYLGKREPDRDVPALRQLSSRPAPDEMLQVVNAAFGSNKKLARQAGMWFCHRYSGEKIREIGKLFAVGQSAITEAGRLFPKRMEKDEALAEVIEKIKMALNI